MKTQLLLPLALILLVSCKKNEPSKDGTAGKGGSAVLKVNPQHHGRDIDSCTVYIKYNSQDLPSAFDDSIVCVKEAGKSVATFTQLKKGDYYLYGKGWDSVIASNVQGGLPYSISEENTLTITLPVTEQH